MSAILFASGAWIVFVGACLLIASAGLLWAAAYLTASAARIARRTVSRPVDDLGCDAGAVDLDEPTEVLATPAAVAPLAARLRPHDALAEGLVLPGTWESCITPQGARHGRRLIRRHRQGART